MRLRRPYRLPRRLPHLMVGIGILVLIFGISGPILLTSSKADAALVNLRSVKISDPTTSATGVNYQYDFSTTTNGPIGSITFEVCTNYLYNQTDTCTPPPGYNSSGAALNSSSGVTDFSLQPPSNPQKLLLSRPVATPVSTQHVMYEFTGITNPSAIGSYYVHIATFASTDGSGPEVDYGNVVFATNDSISITTEVPPYLYFCVGITIQGFNCGTVEGSSINFGELSIRSTKAATSEMLASTNAPYGYSVTLAGSTMTAGNNVIPAMTGGSAQIGVSQFGLNARLNTGPVVGADPAGPGLTMPATGYNTPNQFRFVSGDIIASNANTDDYRKMTVSYIVNRDTSQAPGHYVATISYICLANF